MNTKMGKKSSHVHIRKNLTQQAFYTWKYLNPKFPKLLHGIGGPVHI